MNVFLLLAHPERKSFNGALFDTARETLAAEGHTVVTSDLYRLEFEPRSGPGNFIQLQHPEFLKLQREELHASENHGFAAELDEEMIKLESADLTIFQFPLWWFGLPAILKGWVDRVFAMGRFYGRGRRYETGVLRGRRAMLSLTTGGPESTYVPGGEHGDMLSILRPIHRGMLQYIGLDVLAPAIFYSAAHVDDEQRRQWLAEYAERLRKIGEEKPIEVGQYA